MPVPVTCCAGACISVCHHTGTSDSDCTCHCDCWWLYLPAGRGPETVSGAAVLPGSRRRMVATIHHTPLQEQPLVLMEYDPAGPGHRLPAPADDQLDSTGQYGPR